MSHDDDEMMLEIDGPGVSPATIETAPALELVAAYLHLLERVAQEHGDPIHFTGIAIVDKCAAVKVCSDVSATIVRRAVTDTNDYVRGLGECPRSC